MYCGRNSFQLLRHSGEGDSDNEWSSNNKLCVPKYLKGCLEGMHVAM